MSIVPLVKATLYGPSAEKDAVIEGLQNLGCMHLNDLSSSDTDVQHVASPSTDAREAIQYLKDCPVQRRAQRHVPMVDLNAVVKETLEVRKRAQALAEESAQLGKWIADLEPWGDFEMPEWAQEGAARLWFFIVPLRQVAQLQGLNSPWSIVARDHRFAYVVVLASEEPVSVPGEQAFLERQSLRTLRARHERVMQELEELDYRRIGLTLYRDSISNALDEADDRAAREQAARRALEHDQVFAVQGWAPAKLSGALRQFAADRGLAIILAAPSPQDDPPTLLENPAALRGGEGLVQFYRTPGYKMWDPSKSVYLGFAFFFGMIFSDAGYGLLLGVVLLAAWTRLTQTASGRALRGILVALVVWSIIYGALVGTYFGLTAPPGSWLAALHLLDSNDQRLMMWLSIAIGAVHLSLANLVSAWRRRRSSAALSSVGWACIISGGACVGIGKSYAGLAVIANVAWWVIGLGGFFVLLFSSESPFSLAPKALVRRLADGVKAATDITKAFGDVLSYLRLFALGLASFKLGEAFNGLAASSLELGGAGVLLGLGILVVGHGINFVMAIMGGVVHGLRLNVIEFFNWSLPEEGEGFQTFAKKSVEMTV
jgi:V/A-type H+-transporting ATPase subunit I